MQASSHGDKLTPSKYAWHIEHQATSVTNSPHGGVAACRLLAAKARVDADGVVRRMPAVRAICNTKLRACPHYRTPLPHTATAAAHRCRTPLPHD